MQNNPDVQKWTRSCYQWWRDGCTDCVACAVIDSYERGESSAETFSWRMTLLYDTLRDYRDGDHPLTLPRHQLSLFASKRR